MTKFKSAYDLLNSQKKEALELSTECFADGRGRDGQHHLTVAAGIAKAVAKILEEATPEELLSLDPEVPNLEE